MRLRILLPFLAAAAAGCTSAPETQILQGHLSTGSSATAIRAVSDSEVIAAAEIAADGSFELSLPKGRSYRLEMLSSDGVHHVVAHAPGGAKALEFRVCVPQDPFDVGGMGGTDGMGCGGGGPGDGNGGGGPGEPCDPNTDPTCKPPPPPPPGDCDPATGQMCPPCPDPNADGTCPPPPECDPATDPNGCKPPPPPGCDPATDPDGCVCDPATGQMCPPPPDCDPTTDPNGCKPPPPPPDCDPNDPGSCKDPCMTDPATCGCPMGDPGCWDPPPPPCDANGVCDPDGTMAPDKPPGDFGCDDGGG